MGRGPDHAFGAEFGFVVTEARSIAVQTIQSVLKGTGQGSLLTLGLRSSSLTRGALCVADPGGAASAAAAALAAVVASLALCFSRLLSSLKTDPEMLEYPVSSYGQSYSATHVLLTISPVTGSLCDPAGVGSPGASAMNEGLNDRLNTRVVGGRISLSLEE